MVIAPYLIRRKDVSETEPVKQPPKQAKKPTPEPQEQTPNYANNYDYKELLKTWQPKLEKAGVAIDIRKGAGRLHHMRFSAGYTASELDKMLFIMDKLREGLDNDSGSTGQ